MKNWSFVAIGDNEHAQLSTPQLLGMVPFTDIKSLPALVDYLGTKAQPGTTITMADIELININNGVSVTFLPNNHTPGNVAEGYDWAALDASTFIDPVVAEMIIYLEQTIVKH